MRNLLLISIIGLILGFQISFSVQKVTVEYRIVKNGTPKTDTLDNGKIVTYFTSSDDAEQENDEMDALFDDDLDAGWQGAPEDQNILTAGLRFQNIGIPKGAKIITAYMEICSHEEKSAEDVADLTIYGEANDNPATFDLDNLISARPKTNAQINWKVNEKWGLWTYHKSPELSSIIQEIVNRNGWKSGNAMAIVLAGKNQGPSDLENAREFESFENIADPEEGGDGNNHPERVPKLVITYEIEGNAMIEIPIVRNGEPITDTLDGGTVITFETSSDDAEQENDEMDALYDDDLDAGWQGAPEDQNILTLGLRFQNVLIPAKARIDSAFIQVVSHEAKSSEDVAEITIYGEANDNPETYNLESLITDRPKTSAQIDWTVDEEWGLWTTHRTPDLKSIVQELVNRQNWNAGNSIAFTFAGKNQGPSDLENAREMESFENIADPEEGGDGKNHPDRVPKLIVYYTVVGTSVEDNNSAILNVYPNPSNGIINIEISQDANYTINVTDINGNIVASFNQYFSKIATINLSNLANGSYIIELKKGSQANYHNIIINK